MTALDERVVEGVACCTDAELDHCHGSHVQHADGAQECTEARCVVPAEGHAHAVACSVIEPECRCS